MSKTSKKRERGRPALADGAALSCNLTVRMTKPEFDRLADNIGKTKRGKFVRKAIADALQDAGL